MVDRQTDSDRLTVTDRDRQSSGQPSTPTHPPTPQQGPRSIPYIQLQVNDQYGNRVAICEINTQVCRQKIARNHKQSEPRRRRRGSRGFSCLVGFLQNWASEYMKKDAPAQHAAATLQYCAHRTCSSPVIGRTQIDRITIQVARRVWTYC